MWDVSFLSELDTTDPQKKLQHHLLQGPNILLLVVNVDFLPVLTCIEYYVLLFWKPCPTCLILFKLFIL